MVSSAHPFSGRRIGVVQAVALMVAFVLISGLGGLLAAGLVMPSVATTNVIAQTSVRLFDDLPSELETIPLSEKSTLLTADGTVLAEFYSQNRIVVRLDQMSQAMRNAVLAVEDKRFYEHGGIDPAGLLRALFQNATGDGGGTQGGSTLTQQYVKNMLIQTALQGEDPQDIAEAIREATVASGIEGYARKLNEAKMAIALEQRMTKDEILEGYMNIAQFGYAQIYGVESAALHFFSVHASDLNYLQAATIAGITRAPGLYDPERNPEKAQERRNLVLRLMHEQAMITDEEYQAGVATPLVDTLVPSTTGQDCVVANAISNAGYFCDFVTKIIRNDPAFGETPDERTRLLYRGGLTITTTLDRGLQAAADEEVKRGVPPGDPSGVGSAISVVQPNTGYVLAIAQSTVYSPSQVPAPGQTAVNWNTDNVYGGASGFPPGSAFKPFTLMEWFRRGHSLDEVVNGTQRMRNEREFVACGARLGNTPWNLGNADGGRGMMSVLDATRNSVNNAYADMASKLDLCDIMNGAAALGIHKAGGMAGEGNFDPFPANVIGSQSVAPLTMAAAFAGFAAGGVFCDPVAIISVVDGNGNQLAVPQPNCRQAIDPSIANAVAWTLTHVWEGTGRSLGGIGRPAAGKTGTTSANEHTWFVGFTPQIATAVWTGYPDAMRPMQGVTINGTYYGHVYGATISGATWVRFMQRAHQGAPVIGFGEPASTYLHGVQIQVPDVVGRSAEEAKQILQDAGFNPTFDPYTRFSEYPADTVAGTMPAGGSTAVRGSAITITVSAGPDPNGPVPGWPPGRGGDG
jgi:membrane peptidoglycan carboxypeptidase